MYDMCPYLFSRLNTPFLEYWNVRRIYVRESYVYGLTRLGRVSTLQATEIATTEQAPGSVKRFDIGDTDPNGYYSSHITGLLN